MKIIVLVTCANKEEAKKIAKALVEKKQAACVNIIDGIESVFWWEGKIDSSKEILLIIKSTEENFKKIEESVKSLHSYEVPEIISFNIDRGEEKYLNWIHDSVI